MVKYKKINSKYEVSNLKTEGIEKTLTTVKRKSMSQD